MAGNDDRDMAVRATRSFPRRRTWSVAVALVAIGLSVGCAGRVGSDTTMTTPTARVLGVVPGDGPDPSGEVTSTVPASASTTAPTTTTAVPTTTSRATTTTEEQPYTAALGEAQDLGDWTVTVTAVDPSATARVLAENPFNEPPTSGAYVVVDLTATYRGSTWGTPFDLTVAMINGDGQVIEPYSFRTAVVCPDDLLTQPDVVAGGSVTGSVCLDIATYTSGIVNVSTGFGRHFAYWQGVPRP